MDEQEEKMLEITNLPPIEFSTATVIVASGANGDDMDAAVPTAGYSVLDGFEEVTQGLRQKYIFSCSVFC